jgi:hypothetical protein
LWLRAEGQQRRTTREKKGQQWDSLQQSVGPVKHFANLG